MTDEGVKTGGITGKLQFDNQFPKVGDFILYNISDDGSYNSIYKILDRRTYLSRKEAGLTSNEQILACNIDYAFLVMSLNDDFNLRRIERYLIAAWESGAETIVVLTKADVCNDLEEKLESIKQATFGLTVISISALTGYKMEQLDDYNANGKLLR